MALIGGLIVGVITGLIGFWLRHQTKMTIVEVSAWLTLSGGIILPRLHSEGYLWALICTCVSYAVMSDEERIANYKEASIVSLICAFVVYYGQNLLVGIGGRLGSIAALSVVFLAILKKVKERGWEHDQLNASS